MPCRVIFCHSNYCPRTVLPIYHTYFIPDGLNHHLNFKDLELLVPADHSERCRIAEELNRGDPLCLPDLVIGRTSIGRDAVTNPGRPLLAVIYLGMAIADVLNSVCCQIRMLLPPCGLDFGRHRRYRGRTSDWSNLKIAGRRISLPVGFRDLLVTLLSMEERRSSALGKMTAMAAFVILRFETAGSLMAVVTVYEEDEAARDDERCRGRGQLRSVVGSLAGDGEDGARYLGAPAAH
ncbi:hypothetical protein ACLOJK_028005 [Asimina triloba]